MSKFFSNLWEWKGIIMGSAFSCFAIWRFNINFDEFNRAITKEYQ